MDRRTACLNQANAFREKAIADPEHHDQWIDEAIKWLELAMEAGYHVAVEAGDGCTIPEPMERQTRSYRIGLMRRPDCVPCENESPQSSAAPSLFR
ncbi:hypothetical protein Q3C01_15575 [Bradyrhizobium sp. UFLA05-109]